MNKFVHSHVLELELVYLAVDVFPEIESDQLSAGQHGNSEVIEAGVALVRIEYRVATRAAQRALSGSSAILMRILMNLAFRNAFCSIIILIVLV